MTLSSTDQTNPRSDAYTSEEITFTYEPFTVVPSFCAMTIQCNNIAPVNENMPCQELVDGKLTWNFTPADYTDKKIAPGNYVYTFDVSTDDNQAELTE